MLNKVSITEPAAGTRGLLNGGYRLNLVAASLR
jgi:hypothetical protein